MQNGECFGIIPYINKKLLNLIVGVLTPLLTLCWKHLLTIAITKGYNAINYWAINVEILKTGYSLCCACAILFVLVDYSSLVSMVSSPIAKYTHDSIFVDTTRSGNTQFRRDFQRFVTFMK